jgi:hypothetical protein
VHHSWRLFKAIKTAPGGIHELLNIIVRHGRPPLLVLLRDINEQINEKLLDLTSKHLTGPSRGEFKKQDKIVKQYV